MKRFVSVIVVCALALMGTSALADIMQVVNCDEWVTMRTRSDRTSEWVCRVPLGDVVNAEYPEGEFYFCTYNGMSGYILADYLSANVSTPGAGAQEGSYRRIVNCQSYVTLREQPDTSAYELDTVPLGAIVTAFDQTGDFTRCYYDGMTGYILTQYLGSTNTRHIVKCQSYVTLRREPSTSAASEAQVPLGEEVEYLGEAENGFSHCAYGGVEGYILTAYLGD